MDKSVTVERRQVDGLDIYEVVMTICDKDGYVTDKIADFLTYEKAVTLAKQAKKVYRISNRITII